MKRCGARTVQGRPCARWGNGKGNRCPKHGGASTGPLTPEGRARIAAAQTKRWAQWRADNPRLFTAEVGQRQERRIKKAWKARKKLRTETREWLLSRNGVQEPRLQKQLDRLDKATCLVEQVEEKYRLYQERQAEEKRRREAAKLPTLTPEQAAQADKFLAEWATTPPRTDIVSWLQCQLAPHGYTVRKPESATDAWLDRALESTKVHQPAPTLPAPTPVEELQKLEAQIERQPPHRIHKLEQRERIEADNALGRELMRRHPKSRPESYLPATGTRAMHRRQRQRCMSD